MDKNGITALVTSLVEPLTAELGLELVDVEYVREKDWFLRVYINKEGGVGIDDCAAISSRLTKLLDEKDPIKEKYYLEVSSPGIDRPLKKDKDFLANYGKKVDLQFFAPMDGKKQWTFTLVSHTDDAVVVSDGKEEKNITRDKLVAIRPHIEF